MLYISPVFIYGTSGSCIINYFHAVVPLSITFLNESHFHMYARSRKKLPSGIVAFAFSYC